MAGPSVESPAYTRAVNSGFQFFLPSGEKAYFQPSRQALTSSAIVWAFKGATALINNAAISNTFLMSLIKLGW